jgi:hypothetical protein
MDGISGPRQKKMMLSYVTGNWQDKKSAGRDRRVTNLP